MYCTHSCVPLCGHQVKRGILVSSDFFGWMPSLRAEIASPLWECEAVAGIFPIRAFLPGFEAATGTLLRSLWQRMQCLLRIG